MNRTKLLRRAIEALLVLICGYTFVFATPVGELLRYSANRIFSSKAKRRPLVSYFETLGAEANKEAIARRLATPLNKKDPLFVQAKALGLSPELARALMVSLSEGKLAVDGDARISVPQAGLRSLSAVGMKGFKTISKAAKRRSELLRGVAALKAKLQSEHAAIAALSVDLKHIKYALNRARAAGLSSPTSFAAFSRFLPPSIRSKARIHVASVFAMETAFGMKTPVRASHRVTSRFGYRVHPVLKTRKKHTGIDVAISTGTALHAAAAGRVVYATKDGINGKFVKINHGNGLTSAYCHASKLLVKRGEKIKQGQKIALSGMTGRATGPHLHFQIEIDDVPIDPELFIRSFSKPKPLSLGPKIDAHRRGFPKNHGHITDGRGRHGEAKTIEQLKLHRIQIGRQSVL
jgi:murein DD-endopeptidase